MIASFISFVWQQGSQIIPKLTMMFSVCRCLHAKRLQPFSSQGCDPVSLFLELLPRGLCWVLCMFLKQSITTRNFALNLWSYPGQLITSDRFFFFYISKSSYLVYCSAENIDMLSTEGFFTSTKERSSTVHILIKRVEFRENK